MDRARLGETCGVALPVNLALASASSMSSLTVKNATSSRVPVA